MIQILILVWLLQQQLLFVLGVEQVLLDLLLQPACRLSQDALLQFAISQSVTHSHQISPCDVIGNSDGEHNLIIPQSYLVAALAQVGVFAGA